MYWMLDRKWTLATKRQKYVLHEGMEAAVKLGTGCGYLLL